MSEIVSKLLDVFQGYRMAPTPLDQYDLVGKAVLASRLEQFVVAGNVIKFVMLGFPFKSANMRDKVIGQLPDLAEEATLQNFAQFNMDVKQIYPAGVEIAIARDGYVFNDLLGIDDSIVEEYGAVSADMGRNAQAPMSWYNLSDFYKGTMASNREKIMTQLAPTPQKLEADILTNADTNYLYRGMIIFMQEELAIHQFPSKSQLQKAAKKLVREMMMRNDAWSNLVKTEFSDHIRLSMHPSINDGNKYSFQLIRGPRTKYSAWHSAIWVNGEELVTIHKKEAEAQGLRLVDQHGRPYNYTN